MTVQSDSAVFYKIAHLKRNGIWHSLVCYPYVAVSFAVLRSLTRLWLVKFRKGYFCLIRIE